MASKFRMTDFVTDLSNYKFLFDLLSFKHNASFVSRLPTIRRQKGGHSPMARRGLQSGDVANSSENVRSSGNLATEEPSHGDSTSTIKRNSDGKFPHF